MKDIVAIFKTMSKNISVSMETIQFRE